MSDFLIFHRDTGAIWPVSANTPQELADVVEATWPEVTSGDIGVVDVARLASLADGQVSPTFVTEEQNRETLLQRATEGIQANKTYLAIPSPTNAQVVTQVQRLTKEVTALIRLLLAELEDDTGT